MLCRPTMQLAHVRARVLLARRGLQVYDPVIMSSDEEADIKKRIEMVQFACADCSAAPRHPTHACAITGCKSAVYWGTRSAQMRNDMHICCCMCRPFPHRRVDSLVQRGVWVQSARSTCRPHKRNTNTLLGPTLAV